MLQPYWVFMTKKALIINTSDYEKGDETMTDKKKKLIKFNAIAVGTFCTFMVLFVNIVLK